MARSHHCGALDENKTGAATGKGEARRRSGTLRELKRKERGLPCRGAVLLQKKSALIWVDEDD
jgi:hypothetical protein